MERSKNRFRRQTERRDNVLKLNGVLNWRLANQPTTRHDCKKEIAHSKFSEGTWVRRDIRWKIMQLRSRLKELYQSEVTVSLEIESSKYKLQIGLQITVLNLV